MERKNLALLVLVLFAALVAAVGAEAPKFGDIPNPPGMNYGWDEDSKTIRAFTVDASGSLRVLGPAVFVDQTGNTSPATLTMDGGVPVELVSGHRDVSVFVTNESIKVTPPAGEHPPLNVRIMDPNLTYMGDQTNPMHVKINNILDANKVYDDSGNIVSEQAKYSRVSASTNARANIATGSVTLLSSIASITPPCMIQISCPLGRLWYAPGLATAAVDSAKIHILDEAQSVTFNVATSTWDCSLVGVSTVSSCSVTIHSLTQ